MSSGGRAVEVTHYHYHTWPDFGTPRTPTGFIELVRNVGATRERDPILVHCSAGLGRSGVFVAVHSSLEAQGRGERVDLETTTREMRKQRGAMIQTEEQYRFCFEAVAEALDPILPPEDEPRGQSERIMMGVSPPRPSSEPLPGHETAHTTTTKKLYLQHTIPPPPSYPPPTKEPPFAERRVSSPPPPSSSPPPPLTPSTSGETTPTKIPVSSPEATPIKHSSASTPGIVVTPPTRQPSLSSINQNFRSIDRKNLKKHDEHTSEETKSQEPPNTSKSDQVSGKNPLTSKAAVQTDQSSQTGKEQSLKQKGDDRGQPSSSPSTSEPEPHKETPLSEDELKKNLEGYEVPPPKNQEVGPPEEGGFEIGDDQLVVGPPPRMEVRAAEERPRPKWGGSLLFEKQTPKSVLSPGSTKPRKWEQVSPSHSIPQPVNRGEVERSESVRKVGKLVIPGIFGMSVKQTPPPERKPVNPVSKPVKPVTPIGEADTPQLVSGPPEPHDTRSVQRLIKQMEAETQKPAIPNRSTPVSKPVEPVVQEPPQPVKQEPPKPDKPAQPDSPPAPSVKALLLQFEKKT